MKDSTKGIIVIIISVIVFYGTMSILWRIWEKAIGVTKTKVEGLLFLVDSMLGNIAKKLQLLGYDSEYYSNIDDLKLYFQRFLIFTLL